MYSCLFRSCWFSSSSGSQAVQPTRFEHSSLFSSLWFFSSFGQSTNHVSQQQHFASVQLTPRQYHTIHVIPEQLEHHPTSFFITNPREVRGKDGVLHFAYKFALFVDIRDFRDGLIGARVVGENALLAKAPSVPRAFREKAEYANLSQQLRLHQDYPEEAIRSMENASDVEQNALITT